MTEAARQKRNETRLLELYPTFRARLKRAIAWLESQGVRPRIQDGYRSPADQLKAFNAGNSKLRFGFHNVTGAGGQPESLAVDLLDDDSPLSPSKRYLLMLAFAAGKAGLSTGIRWGVPAVLAAAIDTAIKNQDWSANVKIGWDPTHVQPVGITTTEAKAGKRPA